MQNIPVWDLSYRNDKVKQIIRAEYIARIEEERNACGALLGKSEVKKSLGRPRRRWENNITMDLRETGWDDMEWIHLAEDRDQWKELKNTTMNLRVP